MATYRVFSTDFSELRTSFEKVAQSTKESQFRTISLASLTRNVPELRRVAASRSPVEIDRKLAKMKNNKGNYSNLVILPNL